MKKVFILFIMFMVLFSCGVKKKATETTPPSKMILLIDTTFTRHQLDSLCIADTLSMNFEKWNTIWFLDYETNVVVYEYSYIKNINEDILMYRVIQDGENYKIIKRLTDN